MKPQFEDHALLRCVDTGDSEIVTVHEIVPRVQLVLNLWPGTKNYKRLTLQWVSDDIGYSAEIWGRQFVSRGPKIVGARVTPPNRGWNGRT